MVKIYDAPAKVNLHLAITDVRDDGYHVLDTSFVYVDIADKLHIQAADDLLVTCSNPDFSGENNLVHQVLQAFRSQFAVSKGLSVHVEKYLPAQAGLGGGSSDAATALMVANKMWGVGCDTAALITFATPFGADIPCFLFQQASLASGIGEDLKLYKQLIPQQHVVLAWPGAGISTVAAFQHYDQQKKSLLTQDKRDANLRSRSGTMAFKVGFNDLEQSALSLCSPLAGMLSAMREKSERAWMSGSGSACVALCSSPEQANVLAVDLQQQGLASWTFVGRFLREHPFYEQ